jgi:hypothetical protein
MLALPHCAGNATATASMAFVQAGTVVKGARPMERQRTEAESDLLDVADWATGLRESERHLQLEPVLNVVLREAARDGYELFYDAREGIHLHTPSGVFIWFCPSATGVGMDVLLID